MENYTMPCFTPLVAYRSLVANGTGKYPLIFSPGNLRAGDQMKVRCGKCEDCHLHRARNWAIRCLHEASLYENNCFITLTYRDEDLPPYRSLVKRDFQLFMKRLRKKYGEGIRYFHCGEYGSKLGRPHYHAILFNFDFDAKKLWKKVSGYPLYRSLRLEDLWTKGHSSVGTATFQSAGYVARYVLKKVNGSQAVKHYDSGFHDFDTGEIITKQPEYTTMSRRPGIGKAWFDKYYSDVYPHDNVVINGLEFKPPRYYDDKYALINPLGMDNIKFLRQVEAFKRVVDNTAERLAVSRKITMSRLGRLPRNLDYDHF